MNEEVKTGADASSASTEKVIFDRSKRGTVMPEESRRDYNVTALVME
jgi:hypothetical protein